MAELGLVALPTEVRSGLIWIQAKGSMDLEQHLAGLDSDLEMFDMADYHFLRTKCAHH